MLRKLFTLWLASMSIVLIVHGQTPANLDINGIDAMIHPSGDLFWDLIGNNQFEVPKGSGSHTLFAANLWMGGIDQSGSLRIAANTYRQSGHDTWAGPVANSYSTFYDNRYNRVWKITKTQIDDHILNWNNPGYTVPPVIADWPAHGDVTNGEAARLALFHDANGNGTYEPALGDYPHIRGDMAVFFIYNDTRTIHTETGGDPLGVEVHGMAYAYDRPQDSIIHHTIFFNYTIFNRSGSRINDFSIGNWVDFDLGFFRDDYVGCDTTRNTFYGYNGDSYDDGMFGYGANPPAQAITFLNLPMTHFATYNNDFDSMGNPTSPAAYYGYLTGYWPDGSPWVDNYNNGGPGTGHGNGIPTSYLLPGDPVNGTGWTEKNSARPPSDRRGMGSTSSITFDSGEKICLDLAYVYARGYFMDEIGSVANMASHVDSIQRFYNAQGYQCNSTMTTSVERELLDAEVSISPNPTSSALFVKYSRALSPSVRWQLTDIQGRDLGKGAHPGIGRQALDLSALSAGMYMLRLHIDNQVVVKKVVKR